MRLADASLHEHRAFHPRRYCWPELMKRVYAVDVLDCPACHGLLRILAAIHPPDTTRAILDCLGLPGRPPPIAPAEPGLDEQPAEQGEGWADPS